VIYILRGGPTDNKYIKAWIHNICAGWIDYNLLNKFPDEKVTYRYENTGSIHEIKKR
jgi:hypothetical protein